MKRFLTLFLALALPLTLLAQTPQEDYVRRYNNLISRVGPAGVGVETLLDRWAEEYPDDIQQLLARFSFWFTKSQTTNVIQLPQDRYLGREPLLPMTDSLGRKNNFFEDTVYDDEMFGQALEALDKAVSLEPKRLDFRLLRIDALTAYEKGSPDMALSALKALTDENYKQHPAWTHESLEKVDDEVFNALIQDYCFTFFKIASPSAYEAFRQVSEQMLRYEPGDPVFLDNLGSYYLVYKKDSKKALSYYNKVLKKHPDDLTALRNCVVVARHEKNPKLEKKYLPLLIKYTDNDTERASSEARLQAMNSK